MRHRLAEEFLGGIFICVAATSLEKARARPIGRNFCGSGIENFVPSFRRVRHQVTSIYEPLPNVK